MQVLLKQFRIYLIEKWYEKRVIEWYIRAVSVFLLWYHSDISDIRPFHLERFCQLLHIKKYPPNKINKYRTSLNLFSNILKDTPWKNDTLGLRKKLHRNDEVSSK